MDRLEGTDDPIRDAAANIVAWEGNSPAVGYCAFDGTWNAGFDHAEALAKISCRTLLMHADFSFLPDGTLNGAMTQQDADKAVSLLANGTYRKVNATHVVHLDKPDLYIDVLHDFFLQPHLYDSRRSWV